MNTQQNKRGQQDANRQTAQSQETGKDANVQISQPHTERPEGPFEHSGETAGWTAQEKEESKQQDQP